MSNKFLFSLAMTGLLVATAGADSTTVEKITDWFSVTASSEDVAHATNTKWTGTVATKESNLIKVDSAIAAPAIYTPGSKPDATRYRITGNMTVTLNAAVPGNDVFGNTLPKAALVAVAGESNKWYAWHLTGNGTGEWAEVTSATAPAEGTNYPFTIDISAAKVKYTVGGATIELVNAGGSVNVTQIGLSGYGFFGDFAAKGFESMTYEYDAGSLVNGDQLDTSSSLYKSLTAAGMTVTKETNATSIETFLNGTGANKLPNWQNYVLGLNSTDANAKPFTAPKQNDSTDTLSFELGGVNASSITASGATVTFSVYESDSPTGAGTLVAGTADTAASGTASATLSSSGVKYYRVKVKITKSEQQQAQE